MNRYKFDFLNHIHLLDEKPLCGTTTVLGIVSKPLTWWSAGLAVKEISGIEDTKVFTKIKNKKATKEEVKDVKEKCEKSLENIRKIDIDTFIKLMDSAYRAHSVKLDDSAGEGVDLHAMCERFVNYKMGKFPKGTEYEINEKIKPFVEWCEKNVKNYLWSEMYCYSEKYWLGGISDIGVELNTGEFAIIDIKSSKEAYASQYWQCASYDIQISENGGYDMNGNKVFTLEKPISKYIIFPFGAKEVVPYICERVEESRKAFLGCLEAYKEQLYYQDK